MLNKINLKDFRVNKYLLASLCDNNIQRSLLMAKFTEIVCIFQKLHVKFVKAHTQFIN